MAMDAGVAGTMAAPSRQVAAVGTASSSSSPCVVGIGVRSLPACRGLRRANLGVKVSSRAAVRSAPSLSSPSSSSRGNIVSEAQETVTGVAGVVNESTWPNLVLESDIPVLVDFWAPWCGPCRMIAPLIDDIAKQYAGKVRCLKLNTDESPGIATEYGIRSIPTVMIFTKGVKRDAVIGAVPKTALTTTLDKYLDWWVVYINQIGASEATPNELVESFRGSMLRSWGHVSRL